MLHFIEDFFPNQKGRRSIAGLGSGAARARLARVLEKKLPIKCSTCKTSVGFIKKYPIKFSTCKTRAGLNKTEISFNFTREIL